MRGSDMIGIVGKTHDATQTQAVRARTHETAQQHLAAREAEQARHDALRTLPPAPQDGLDLHTDQRPPSSHDQEHDQRERHAPDGPDGDGETAPPTDEYHIDLWM